MRWTRRCARRCDLDGGRSSRVVVVPRRWDQPPGLRARGGRRLTSPVLRREREVSRKPLRRECRMFRPYLTDLCALFPFQHTRLRVRPAPGIPCALCLRGSDGLMHHPDAKSRRGNAEFVIASEGRSNPESFHGPISGFLRLWIASSRSLSSGRAFARTRWLLAMTAIS